MVYHMREKGNIISGSIINLQWTDILFRHTLDILDCYNLGKCIENVWLENETLRFVWNNMLGLEFNKTLMGN